MKRWVNIKKWKIKTREDINYNNTILKSNEISLGFKNEKSEEKKNKIWI